VAGQVGGVELTGCRAFEGWKPMTKHRSHSIEFKRQIAQEFLGGETLHGLAKRHDISRNLIRVWVEKYETGAFDDDARAADLLQAYDLPPFWWTRVTAYAAAASCSFCIGVM
jgi:transposase-like protein